ncbi:uncharacterized protein B0H18DRAFT_1033740 [Fomitopsis serialis]|uniref:uncharacterized protein n=1 Tax=Fomitopsis serialis TaxID=139415 RepID=UPI0020084E49|nr:uncharacterized protein B0H18DRAFT_1033740 [Neoantrodia serialis]KAH9917746.1 hypothetical protein B0H18DRAFT_1033740 [Neoantrodia serialis]
MQDEGGGRDLVSAQTQAPLSLGGVCPHDDYGPHVSLYEPAFAEAWESLNEATNNPTAFKPSDDFDMVSFMARLKTAVNDPRHKLEPEYSNTVSGLLAQLFDQPLFDSKHVYRQDKKNDRRILTEIDHTATCPVANGFEVPYVIVEDKLLNGPADVQSVSTYQHLYGAVNQAYDSIRYSSCCPCLLVGMVGTIMTFRAVYATDIVHSDLLWVLGLPCGSSAGVDAIAKQLHVFRQLARDLRRSYAKLHIGAPTGRAIFLATYGEGAATTVYVKFVSGPYGAEAQERLAEAGFAPKLLFFCKLKGGLSMVIMEAVPGGDLTEERLQSPQVMDDVSRAIEELHRHNLVFGDLRAPNVVVADKEMANSFRPGGAYLVDFDWAGRDGTARFPYNLNTSIAWPDGVTPGSVITKDHDLAMLETLRSKMETDVRSDGMREETGSSVYWCE